MDSQRPNQKCIQVLFLNALPDQHLYVFHENKLYVKILFSLFETKLLLREEKIYYNVHFLKYTGSYPYLQAFILNKYLITTNLIKMQDLGLP